MGMGPIGQNEEVEMSDSSETKSKTYHLPEKLTTAQANGLFKDLVEHRGSDLIIDAGAVVFLGGLCLQVLMSAQKTWASDAMSLEFSNALGAFTDCVHALGASDLLVEGNVA